MASLVVLMPPAGLTPDLGAGEVAPVAHGLEHDERDGQGGRRLDLAGGRLDEVAAGEHREVGRAADVVVGDELAGLHDDLEVGGAAGGLDLGDLVEDREVVAREERPAVDDHVDLVGAGLDGVAGVGELDRHARAARREGGRDGRDVDAAVAEGRLRGGDHVAVDADRGGPRRRRVERVGHEGLGAQRADLADGVGALERGQVDHPDGGVDRPGLARRLDRAGAERRRPAPRSRPGRHRAGRAARRSGHGSSGATPRGRPAPAR